MTPGWAALLSRYERFVNRVRTLPPLAVDAAIVLACAVMSLVMAPAGTHAQWPHLALAVGGTLPLLWRRRYPLMTTALVGVGTTWLAVVNALGGFPAAQLVATYTFASLCPPARRLVGALGTTVGIAVSITVPGEQLLVFAPTAIMFVTAYALGAGARARREALDERARRLAEEQAAAATRERERIAREMHDILAHSMSLVIVQAEAGPLAARTDPDKAEKVFETISGTAREALMQLRRALGVLRSDEPQSAPQPGLDALPPLVTSVHGTGLVATFTQHGEPRPVPPDLATTVYRIVQEALTNTVTHAAAGCVRVDLRWRPDSLHVEVADDGRGASAPTGQGGRGLRGMRERVSAAGGKLTTGAAENGAGFRVVARLPLP